MAETRNEQGLTKKQILYIETAMQFPKLPQAEIARKINVNVATVSQWKKEPAFMSALDARIKEAFSELQRPAVDAMAILVEENDFQASKWVLECLGYNPKQKIELSTPDAITINIVDDIK